MTPSAVQSWCYVRTATHNYITSSPLSSNRLADWPVVRRRGVFARVSTGSASSCVTWISRRKGLTEGENGCMLFLEGCIQKSKWMVTGLLRLVTRYPPELLMSDWIGSPVRFSGAALTFFWLSRRFWRFLTFCSGFLTIWCCVTYQMRSAVVVARLMLGPERGVTSCSEFFSACGSDNSYCMW